MTDRIGELLAKYWTDRITPEEKTELERLLLEHPDNWLKTGLMQQIDWELTPLLPEKRLSRLTDKILGDLRHGDKDKGPGESLPLRPTASSPYRRWLPAAAAAALIIAAGVITLFRQKADVGDGQRWQQVTTAKGMKTSLRLADGSALWLNAGSSLRYPGNIREAPREVFLKGEAYVEVQHQPSRPFVIHTRDMEIRVQGSALNVRAYEDEPYAVTSLLSGTAEVKVSHRTQQIYLKPGQQVIVRQTKARPAAADSAAQDVTLKPLRRTGDSLVPETAWTNNILFFENATLAELTPRLERWYGLDILIQDTALAQQRFSGRADNLSLDQLLHNLQKIRPFTYHIHDKQVIIP